jgi:ubiquinone/menaquinone biosynthesis C-methylase UbiE
MAESIDYKFALVGTWLRNWWRRRKALRSMNRILGPRKFQGRYEDIREVEYLERTMHELSKPPKQEEA